MSCIIIIYSILIVVSHLGVDASNQSEILVQNHSEQDNYTTIYAVRSGDDMERKESGHCRKGSMKNIGDACPSGSSCQLVGYGCCINCSVTGNNCEPHNCKETYACSTLMKQSTHLDLGNTGVSVLPVNVFSGLSALTDLHLYENNITVLPTNVFYGLSQLTSLNIRRNRIEALSPGLFNDLSNLGRLELDSNQIKIIPKGLFRYTTNLTYLSLDRNRISHLPPDLFTGLTKLQVLLLSENNLTVLHGNVFAGLFELTRLTLGLNQISIIPSNIFNGLSRLQILDLIENNITVIPGGLFDGLSELKGLFLSSNNILVLLPNLFNGLTELKQLYLNRNHITALPDGLFNSLVKLGYLDLSWNKISFLSSQVINRLSNLRYLLLQRNNLMELPHDLFQGLVRLMVLYLNHNRISAIPSNLFKRTVYTAQQRLEFSSSNTTSFQFFHAPHPLFDLDFSDNQIKVVPYDAFKGLTQLYYLRLRNNAISLLPANVFFEMNIRYLDLSYNKLAHLPSLPRNLHSLNIMGNEIAVRENMYQGLNNLRNLYTDVPFMCCVRPPSVEEGNCAATQLSLFECYLKKDECKPKNDAISSCFALISSTGLRAWLWIIGTCALLGNLSVILYRLFVDKDNITKNYSLFTLNLAVSDLLMGVYLLIIGVVDMYYNGKYAWNDQEWRQGVLCTSAGILSTISSQMSTFIILMVTIDRLVVIMFPLSRLSKRSITWKQAVFMSMLLWIISVTLAIVPVVVMQSYFKGRFYSQSSVCLALPLKGDKQPGTDYSFGLFVCLNSFIFLVIAVSQMCICKSLRKSGRCITASQNRKREMAVATTLFFVVATDFCCWFPIGVMGIISRCGVDIPDTVYAWVMVFVLPVNAAINPFLYTGTAVWRNRKKLQMASPMRLQVCENRNRPSVEK